MAYMILRAIQKFCPVGFRVEKQIAASDELVNNDLIKNQALSKIVDIEVHTKLHSATRYRTFL
jgi:hypothetical protein